MKYKWKPITTRKMLLWTSIFICCVTSIMFVYHNYSFYERPLAKIIDTTIIDSEDVTDQFDNQDTIYTQHLTAEIKNGHNKGQWIELTNQYSLSGAYDQPFEVGNDVFIAFDNNTDGEELTASIIDVKRDKYVVIVGWVFLLTLLLIGKRQGLFAAISLGVNLIILYFALDIYVSTGFNLIWIIGVIALLFTVLSLLLVNGFNEKTYAAIIATILGTFGSVLIAFLVMWLTLGNGLHYEEMQFLTRPYRLVFLAGLFIGSLGAVMDVAISISASMFELYQSKPSISLKKLKASGMDIGRDIMGTMANILLFAYISGTMPILILYIKNYSPLGYTLSINLSLELARALAGGIGIVITIPIGLYVSIFFINRKKVRS